MKAVIFDWDGTLADSHRSLFEANVAVMRALGLPFDEAIYRRHFVPDWRLMYRRLGVPDDRVDEANRIWHEAYDTGAPSALVPGALTAVERLEAAGIATALVTSGDRATVESQMRRLGFTARLAVRVFGDDVAQQKPDPAPLQRAVRELGMASGDLAAVAYLGDAPDDMRMARAAGVRAVGVVSVFSTEAALLDAGAEAVVASVTEWVDGLLSDADGSAVRRAS